MLTCKERRKAGGWSREEIAALAEISVSTLYRIEERGAAPTRVVARAIEAALSIKESEAKATA